MLRRALPAKTILVLDSAYAECAKDDRLATNKFLIEPNVITTRMFSKIHSLAVPRIGRMRADAEFAKAISKEVQAGDAKAVSSSHYYRALSGFNLF